MGETQPYRGDTGSYPTDNTAPYPTDNTRPYSITNRSRPYGGPLLSDYFDQVFMDPLGRGRGRSLGPLMGAGIFSELQDAMEKEMAAADEEFKMIERNW